ncbi:hypothetical protein LTR53_008519 [Teratosphaeriaceae sp. CCFEE 6253]|nr:hypothetical protein LTR53_008519 [Teratosphaeriaceae sp. CCFEE 6253]
MSSTHQHTSASSEALHNEQGRWAAMPTLRGINITLHSQYDALAIPEYTAAGLAIPPRHLPLQDAAMGETHVGECESTPVDGAASAVDIHIPVYQNSQFWLSYSCPPSPADRSFRYWYFKLCVGDQCLVSWGTSERENWRGKTMFALFHGGMDFERRGVVEKRGLFFPDSARAAARGKGAVFKVKVFRAVARKREKGAAGGFDVAAFGGAALRCDGINSRFAAMIPKIGNLERGERPSRFVYALLDAVDEPYAAFRYHFQASESSSPSSDGTFDDITTMSEATSVSAADNRTSERRLRRRLSVPPSGPLQLQPAGHRAGPSSPVKQLTQKRAILAHAEEEESDEKPHSNPRAGGEVEDSVVKISSPGRLNGSRVARSATPPSARAESGSVSLLRNLMTSALRRRNLGGGAIEGEGSRGSP